MLNSNRRARSGLEGHPLGRRVAEIVRDELRRNPRAVLGLAAGRTPTDVYHYLSQWSREGDLDWSMAKCFGLDDYWGVPDEDSFAWYLEHHLYRNINLPKNSRFNPLHDPSYDELIEKCGGLDLTLLGIGLNGHIAFNEPGTPFSSWTHCVYLVESTRTANAELFESGQVPERAVTMGLQTIFKSRKIVLMAAGERKRGILQRALSGPITEDVPASLLQQHNCLVVETDFAL